MSIIREFRATLKETGWRGAVKKYGWKLFAVLFVYYLVRDVTIYLLIPYLVSRHLVSS